MTKIRIEKTNVYGDDDDPKKRSEKQSAAAFFYLKGLERLLKTASVFN